MPRLTKEEEAKQKASLDQQKKSLQIFFTKNKRPIDTITEQKSSDESDKRVTCHERLNA
jgi:hypothetical protein